MCVHLHEVKSSHRNPYTSEIHDMSRTCQRFLARFSPVSPDWDFLGPQKPRDQTWGVGPGAREGIPCSPEPPRPLIDSRRGSPEAALPTPAPTQKIYLGPPLGSLGPNRDRRKGVWREARRQRRRNRPRGAGRSELGGGDPLCTHLREAKRDSPSFRFSSLRS